MQGRHKQNVRQQDAENTSDTEFHLSPKNMHVSFGFRASSKVGKPFNHLLKIQICTPGDHTAVDSAVFFYTWRCPAKAPSPHHANVGTNR
jgi:hypothetical protein